MWLQELYTTEWPALSPSYLQLREHKFLSPLYTQCHREVKGIIQGHVIGPFSLCWIFQHRLHKLYYYYLIRLLFVIPKMITLWESDFFIFIFLTTMPWLLFPRQQLKALINVYVCVKEREREIERERKKGGNCLIKWNRKIFISLLHICVIFMRISKVSFNNEKIRAVTQPDTLYEKISEVAYLQQWQNPWISVLSMLKMLFI